MGLSVCVRALQPPCGHGLSGGTLTEAPKSEVQQHGRLKCVGNEIRIESESSQSLRYQRSPTWPCVRWTELEGSRVPCRLHAQVRSLMVHVMYRSTWNIT